MQQDARKSRAGLVVLFLIIGLIVGAAVAYPIARAMDSDKGGAMNSSTGTQSTATDAAGLRVTLNNLLRDHVATNLAVSYNIIDDAPQNKLQASLDAQTANAVAIADAVGSVYGDEAKQAVTKPFVDHLTASNNYARAVNGGDTAAQASSLTALQTSIRQVADVFHSVIPSLSSDMLYDALNQHETLMNDVAEAYQAGDFSTAYTTQNEALTQISGGADAIADGIVKSKPDMFKS